jgi:hypothetical protein
MAVTEFQDLPLADRDHDWDGSDAEKRVRKWADVVDGRLTVVPHGLMAAGNVTQGGRGGVDLPKHDVDRVRKLGDEPPWER